MTNGASLWICCVVYNDTLFFFSFPCASVRLLKTWIIAGYGSGHVRIFNIETGAIKVEIAAHAKWINAIDVAESADLVSYISNFGWLIEYVMYSRQLYGMNLPRLMISSVVKLFHATVLFLYPLIPWYFLYLFLYLFLYRSLSIPWTYQIFKIAIERIFNVWNSFMRKLFWISNTMCH